MRESGSTSWRAASPPRTSCARSRRPAHPPSRPCAPTSSAPAGDGADGAGRRPRAPRCWSPILLRPQRPSHELPALSLAGGIAAVECARAFGAAAGLSWPNDVVCDGRKLGGVLAELGPGDSVLLGVGMNLSSTAADLPPPDRLATDVAPARDGLCPGRARGADGAAAALRPLAEQLRRGGRRPPSPSARAPLDALAGHARWSCGSRAATSSQGTAAGIADDGACSYATPPASTPTRAARSCA